ETSLLVLSDKTGRPRAGLVTLAQGAPAFTLYDTTGRPRVELGLAREGDPHAALLDARGGSARKAPGARRSAVERRLAQALRYLSKNARQRFQASSAASFL